MTDRPRPYTLGGTDVALVARQADGHVVCAYLDPNGRRTGGHRPAWAHELRRLGTHLAEIKAEIAKLPLANADGALPAPTPIPQEAPAARPRALLFAHHAVPPNDE
jgi:hypothetical protein